jgi:ribosome-associated translation inhibitor RaiA
MRLYIRAKNILHSEEWHDYLQSRLAFALARFDCRIRDITASLTDLNGPKGGVDKQCRLVVRMRPRGKVTIEQSASDFVAAIALAANRVGYAVSRALKRRRDARTKRRRIERAAIAGQARESSVARSNQDL